MTTVSFPIHCLLTIRRDQGDGAVGSDWSRFCGKTSAEIRAPAALSWSSEGHPKPKTNSST